MNILLALYDNLYKEYKKNSIFFWNIYWREQSHFTILKWTLHIECWQNRKIDQINQKAYRCWVYMISDKLCWIEHFEYNLKIWKFKTFKKVNNYIFFSLDLQQVAHMLNSRTLSVRSVLDQESRLWLSAIHRRLAGRVGIRRPYFSQITRCIPYDVFSSLRQVLRDLKADEPDCYFARNNKADVISITNLHFVHKLFSCLSGQTIAEVKTFMKRTLNSMTRYNHKVRVITSSSKDFAFVYKQKSGQLILQFYFGEWNYHGNAQHFG